MQRERRFKSRKLSLRTYSFAQILRVVTGGRHRRSSPAVGAAFGAGACLRRPQVVAARWAEAFGLAALGQLIVVAAEEGDERHYRDDKGGREGEDGEERDKDGGDG